jgi:hypothetical protein
MNLTRLDLRDHVTAHTHCSLHRSELMDSDICGCFYCISTFPVSEIETWTDNDQTAICPKCGIDSVIGSASGYPVDSSFLKRMHDHWF